MIYFPEMSNLDIREELHAVIFGRVDLVAQGRRFLLRRVTDTFCSCWDGLTGGPRQFCPYCQGEGYQWRETLETLFVARGVAPVYKPGALATGQFPMTDYGYDDPNKATGYAEWSVFPDYERYTLQEHRSYDKLFELKVNGDGNLIHPITRTLKWKVLNVVPIFGDFGRVEYHMLSLSKENT